jgi:MerR family transcriptional regulator, light-induced transcriptional regulator
MKMYNINSVSKLTGLTAFVIRAWEKRYNAVIPQRTETNRRVYSDEDIEKLKLLKDVVDSGNNIGSVANLSVQELREMLSLNPVPDKRVLPAAFLENCLTAIKSLDHRGLENYLHRASIEFNHQIIIDDIILPLLKEIGIHWQQGSIRIVQEHLASAVIRTFLYNLRDSYKPGEYSPKILVTTPIGQIHEFGALIASIVASSEGWDAVYLGPDLPSAEIISAAELLRPKVIAISVVYAAEDNYLSKGIEELRSLPAGVKVVAGGSGTGIYKNVIQQIGGVVLNDFNEFREFLRSG